MIPLIHDIPQLDTVCIFRRKKSQHQEWSKNWIKVKGVYKEIVSICQTLQQAIRRCDQNLFPISFVANFERISKANLNQLEPSFMYAEIFKETILGMEFNQQSIEDFIAYSIIYLFIAQHRSSY